MSAAQTYSWQLSCSKKKLWPVQYGYDSGMLNTLKSLIDGGLLSLQDAAQRAKMTEEMFIQKTSQKK